MLIVHGHGITPLRASGRPLSTVPTASSNFGGSRAVFSAALIADRQSAPSDIGDEWASNAAAGVHFASNTVRVVASDSHLRQGANFRERNMLSYADRRKSSFDPLSADWQQHKHHSDGTMKPLRPHNAKAHASDRSLRHYDIGDE
jgi:hypothetical protein